jgi:oxygen-dependent protoporphyrinogen oxidase
MQKVVIVGGGISGLAVAFRLQQAQPSADVLVLEQRSRPGGTVWTDPRDGFRVEVGANGFLDNVPATLRLCQDVGIAQELVPASAEAERNRYLFLDGRLRRLPGTLGELLRSDLLTWRGKVNLAAESLRPGRRSERDESVAEFARRRAGREVAEIFADALVTGIHAGDPALLSLPAAFPRLAALEREHGSVLRGLDQTSRRLRREARANGQPVTGKRRLWSLREGLGSLVRALARQLRLSPLFGTSVEKLQAAPPLNAGDGSWLIIDKRRQSWRADAVVLACPAYQQAAILADLDPELAERIGAIAYNRVAVVALGYRCSAVPAYPSGFGYIAPQRTRRDVLGVQWCSSIFPDRAPAGSVLLRAMCGGWHRAEVAGWDDARLVDAVRTELRASMAITATPVFDSITRWDRAIPQYHMGHLARVSWIEERAARYPGLFLTGNAYRGVALNDCTAQAELVAARIRQYLLSRKSPGR